MKFEQIFAEDYPENKIVSFYYESDNYYDIEAVKHGEGWTFNVVLKRFRKTFVKNVKEEVFASYKEPAEYHVVKTSEGEEIGHLVISKQDWNKTTRIWDIGVDNRYQRRGIGTEMIKLAEKRAKAWDHRALVLETQSSNYKAIQFYLKQGFELRGLDMASYSNEDVEKHEVRFEMYRLLR
ncbi:MAG: GNAT family N-acetyltransferase [Candidatus Odinarchaeota archaeon]